MDSYQIRRLEKEPTNEEIIESIGADNAERNESLIEFIQLLDTIAPPYTIMLDSPWGSGKTFFVKSLQLLLEAANGSTAITKDTYRRSCPLVEQVKQSPSRLIPAYFNAWENDDTSDPIIALFAVLAAQLQVSTKQKELGKAFESLVGLALKAAVPAIGAFTGTTAMVNLDALPDAGTHALKRFKGEDLVECYKQRMSLRKTINEQLERVLSSSDEKIVIFIDELDRCRPDFAIHLLEQTKSLFQNKRIVLVLSCDTIQLASSLKGAYGESYDSTRFLERFYDQKVHLKPADPYKTITGKAFTPMEIGFDRLISEIFQTKALTPRDITRLLPKIEEVRKHVFELENAAYAGRDSICPLLSIAIGAFLPLLIFIEREDSMAYDEIVRGTGFQLLYDEGKKYDEFNHAMEFGREHTRAYQTDTDRSKYARDLYDVIFNSDSAGKHSVEIREAQERLGVWPNDINPGIFTEFKFPTFDDE